MGKRGIILVILLIIIISGSIVFAVEQQREAVTLDIGVGEPKVYEFRDGLWKMKDGEKWVIVEQSTKKSELDQLYISINSQINNNRITSEEGYELGTNTRTLQIYTEASRKSGELASIKTIPARTTIPASKKIQPIEIIGSSGESVITDKGTYPVKDGGVTIEGVAYAVKPEETRLVLVPGATVERPVTTPIPTVVAYTKEGNILLSDGEEVAVHDGGVTIGGVGYTIVKEKIPASLVPVESTGKGTKPPVHKDVPSSETAEKPAPLPGSGAAEVKEEPPAEGAKDGKKTPTYSELKGSDPTLYGIWEGLGGEVAYNKAHFGVDAGKASIVPGLKPEWSGLTDAEKDALKNSPAKIDENAWNTVNRDLANEEPIKKEAAKWNADLTGAKTTDDKIKKIAEAQNKPATATPEGNALGISLRKEDGKTTKTRADYLGEIERKKDEIANRLTGEVQSRNIKQAESKVEELKDVQSELYVEEVDLNGKISKTAEPNVGSSEKALKSAQNSLKAISDRLINKNMQLGLAKQEFAGLNLEAEDAARKGAPDAQQKKQAANLKQGEVNTLEKEFSDLQNMVIGESQRIGRLDQTYTKDLEELNKLQKELESVNTESKKIEGELKEAESGLENAKKTPGVTGKDLQFIDGDIMFANIQTNDVLIYNTETKEFEAVNREDAGEGEYIYGKGLTSYYVDEKGNVKTLPYEAYLFGWQPSNYIAAQELTTAAQGFSQLGGAVSNLVGSKNPGYLDYRAKTGKYLTGTGLSDEIAREICERPNPVKPEAGAVAVTRDPRTFQEIVTASLVGTKSNPITLPAGTVLVDGMKPFDKETTLWLINVQARVKAPTRGAKVPLEERSSLIVMPQLKDKETGKTRNLITKTIEIKEGEDLVFKKKAGFNIIKYSKTDYDEFCLEFGGGLSSLIQGREDNRICTPIQAVKREESEDDANIIGEEEEAVTPEAIEDSVLLD